MLQEEYQKLPKLIHVDPKLLKIKPDLLEKIKKILEEPQIMTLPPPPLLPKLSDILPPHEIVMGPPIQKVIEVQKNTSIFKKIAVLGVYTLLTITHVAATAISSVVETIRDTALLLPSLIKGKGIKELYNYERTKLHFTCTRLALFYMYSFVVPDNHPKSNHFDFHHMSYGLAALLVPGRLSTYGKWQVIDEIGNYDELGIFRDKGGKKRTRCSIQLMGKLMNMSF